MTLHSKICRGEVTHQRLVPRPHAFTYPSTFFTFDLAELDQIAGQTSIFGHNEWNVLSLNDWDYLYGTNRAIIEQLDLILSPQQTGERTLLVTSPRYFGYAFNPVNFHLRVAGSQLLGAVAEVNNTFGDRHIYPLKTLNQVAPDTWTAQCPKAFHVSPFNDMSGTYHFTFQLNRDTLFMGVDLHREGQCVLKTWIRGTAKPISTAAIVRYAVLHLFDTAFNSMPRILWQAAQLYYPKHLKIYPRPSPQSTATLIDRDRPQQDTPIV